MRESRAWLGICLDITFGSGFFICGLNIESYSLVAPGICR
jgi:hypothetical protein